MDPWNERLEIEGDAREDVEGWEDAPLPERPDVDGHYLDWCERNGIVPDMVRTGTDTDAEGEIVTVFRFA